MTTQRRLPHEDKPHVVYAAVGHDATVLYVGVTSDLGSRVKNHRTTKPWWRTDVAIVHSSEPMPWEDALRMEERLIDKHQPRHNRRRRNGSLYVDLGVREAIAAERSARARRTA